MSYFIQISWGSRNALFLSDNFILPSRVDICVERKQLVEVLKVISSTYHLNYYDKIII